MNTDNCSTPRDFLTARYSDLLKIGTLIEEAKTILAQRPSSIQVARNCMPKLAKILQLVTSVQGSFSRGLELPAEDADSRSIKEGLSSAVALFDALFTFVANAACCVRFDFPQDPAEQPTLRSIGKAPAASFDETTYHLGSASNVWLTIKVIINSVAYMPAPE